MYKLGTETMLNLYWQLYRKSMEKVEAFWMIISFSCTFLLSYYNFLLTSYVIWVLIVFNTNEFWSKFKQVWYSYYDDTNDVVF